MKALRHVVCPLLIAAFSLPAATTASEGSSVHEGRDRFGGGMAIQAGYVSVETRHGTVSGPLFGLGGRLHIYAGRFFRAGGAGAAINLHYDDPGEGNSYYRLGYGGLTVEFTAGVERWRFSAGALVGGGGVDHLHVVRAHENDSMRAVFSSEPTFVGAPMLTVEYRVSHSITLMLMGDWLWGPGLGEERQLRGPKLHLGVLFNK
jgi:hypothetical protein